MAGAVVAATYASHSEALIACSFLRSHGFAASLGESYHSQTDWMVGAALGGFRLLVPADEVAGARARLAAVESAAKPECPDCGSTRLGFVTDKPSNWLVALVTFVIAAVPLLGPQRRYHCLDCGRRWNPD